MAGRGAGAGGPARREAGGGRGAPGAPVAALQALEGSEVVVELQSDGRVRGTLEACDGDLNLELSGCEATPPPWAAAALAPGGGVQRLERTRVRGAAVRLVVLSEGVDPAAALRRERSRHQRGAAAFSRQRQRREPLARAPGARAHPQAAEGGGAQ